MASSSRNKLGVSAMIVCQIYTGILLLLIWICGAPGAHGADPTVEFSIEEERPVGTELGSLGDDRVLPLGLDPGVRGSLRYSLLPLGFPRSSLFGVDEYSGQVFTKERMDRESLCGSDSRCDLDIQVAVQSAVSGFFRKVRVTVRVVDINDNAPTFPRPTVQLSVPENVAVGTNFPVEGAGDLDIGSNVVKDYELTPSSGAFFLNVTKGNQGISAVSLVVRHDLDRETKPVHTLTLVARDGGVTPLSGSVTIVVNVEDVNDNAPVFDQPLYNVSLPETATVGTLVTTVSATDADKEAFGVKEYRFSPLNRDDVTRYFTINASSGQIVVGGSLLEKQGETFRLLVECLDRGVPPLVSRVEVDVTVEDTVNSAPTISLNIMFGGSVSEVAQSGTVVALLGVIDRDAGLNGIVSCSIVSDAFELQALSINEYKVIVVRGLDREDEPVHNVTITCEDAGQPRMSDTVNFLIKVKDENDNTPHFLEPSYQKSIPENNKPNQILLKVTALDSDIGENGRITYSLIDADDDLRIDARGNIIAVKQLDHETKPVLRFKVLASDNGAEKRASTADVVIEVTDVNDEAPAFDKPTYEFDVLENLPGNTTVNTVRATDRDSGDNGAVVYSMLPKLSPFRILSNGAIVAKEELDRELQDLYTMTVYAEDKGKPSLTGTATVLIRIGDQNDHKPRILYPRSGNSTVAISFDAKPGAPVLSILAEDEDSGLNKELEYHLVSNPTNQMFKISKETGEIILQRSLTAQDAGRHRLTVVVSDKSPSYQLASNSSFDVIIFAPNETEAAGNDREREHVLVVIVLGVVTGLVTVAVVITIVVIRRADAQRRKYVQSRSKILPEVERLETEKATVEYVISNSVTDGSKVGQDGGDELSRDVTHDEGFADKSFNTSQGSGGATDQSDWSKALRLHQDLLKLHGVDPGFLVQASTGDDVTSDGSCESTTCDSGRGGSEEENGSHGRASPVNKDGTLYNNLNNPPRPQRQPFGQRMNSIQRPAFSSFSSGRPQGHAMDAASPTQSDRSSNAPVKHVSFREDPRRDWPQPNPQQPRGQAMIPGVERWGSTFGVDLHKSDLRGQADLNLTLDQSFDTGDDGNSTTTSGSYTVDDLSPRAMSPRTMSPRAMSPRVMNARNFLPEQAVV